jgi:NADPH2:quinone reductase
MLCVVRSPWVLQAVPSAKLVRVPESVPMDIAVCTPVQALTAHYLTQDAHAGLIKPGEWMLVHAAGGGTCQWAAQERRVSTR